MHCLHHCYSLAHLAKESVADLLQVHGVTEGETGRQAVTMNSMHPHRSSLRAPISITAALLIPNRTTALFGWIEPSGALEVGEVLETMCLSDT